MRRWMVSHFYDWIDYNGVAFSTEFPAELLEWGHKWLLGFENGKICGKKKSCYRNNCSGIFTHRNGFTVDGK